jgi:type III secretion protein C
VLPNNLLSRLTSRFASRLISPFMLMSSLCLVLLATWPHITHARDIAWRNKQRIELQANNEPLNTFLGRLFTLNGIAAHLSPAIASAKVNGRLQGSAETIFKELADTYGLIWYADGAMLYVYSLAETESRLLQVNAADMPRLERTLKEMRLLDSRFALRVSAQEGQVFISGPPQYVQMVAAVAGQVAMAPSQRIQTTDTRLFRLRHARAADTVVNIAGVETTIPGVARILNETLGHGAYRVDSTSQHARAMPVTQPGLRGKGQWAVGRSGVGPGVSDGSGSQSSPVGLPSMSSTPAAPRAMPTSHVVSTHAANASTEPFPAHLGLSARSEPYADRGNERSHEITTTQTSAPAPADIAVVRADPRTNAIIVRDAPERMAMYTRLINQLDVSTPLLEIEATVIDVSHDKSEQLGIDWRAHGQRADVVSSPNGLAGTGLISRNTANDLLYNLPARSSGTGLVGTLLFGSERTNFLLRLNALTQTGDANLISKPRVLTLDNTEAVLQSTHDFYVRVAGRDQVDLFNVSLGLVLRVTPTYIEESDGAKVKLNIRIEDGNTNNGAQVDQIPVVNRNAISTQAVVGDGQSLLIGGYTIEEKSRNSAGIPVLSEVPGLRWLFGQKASTNKRVERIFMITPRLVKPQDLTPSLAQPPQTQSKVSPLPSSNGSLESAGAPLPTPKANNPAPTPYPNQEAAH